MIYNYTSRVAKHSAWRVRSTPVCHAHFPLPPPNPLPVLRPRGRTPSRQTFGGETEMFPPEAPAS